MVRRIGSWLVCVGCALIVGPAIAQSNLDAGKSPAQIFTDTCSACHRSPRELKQAGPRFLQEHYTTGPREAATMAAYLAAIGSDPRAVQQRRPPAMGAGQAPPSEVRPSQTVPPGVSPSPVTAARPQTDPSGGEPAKPTTVVVRNRRPSESMEMGLLPAAPAPGANAETPMAATPQPRPPHLEEFEE